MIKVDIRGIDDVRKLLDRGSKQAKVAAARAINSVGFYALNQGRKHIQESLGNPTPWTVKSWYLRRKATPDKLEAVVGWSDYLSNKGGNAADYYLSQHWQGGSRKHRAFENRLQRAGLMPSGHYAVLGKAASDLNMLDRFGNMKGSVLVSILSGLGAFTESGYSANATTRQSKKIKGNKAAAKKVYWAGKPGKNTPNGIWMIDDKHSRRGRLRPILIFVSAVHYKRRMNLDTIAARAGSKLAGEFGREYDKAMKASA